MQYFLQQLTNALADGSLYALIALGYTMVYGVLRLINFAHGEVFMIGAFSSVYAAQSIVGGGQSQGVVSAMAVTVAAMLAAVVVCGLLGWAIERFAYRPLSRQSRLSALITAIGVSLLLLNLANIPVHIGGLTYFGPTPANYPSADVLGHPVASIKAATGVSLVWKDVLLLVVTACVLGLLWYIVRFTRRGMAMRAVSQSYDSARLMGINLHQTVSFTFVLGSAMAGIGACLYCVKNPQVQPSVGTLFGIKAFVAAVIGGIGNIPGAALGGLLLGVLEMTIKAMGYAQYVDAIVFLTLILMLLVRPEGIFGKAVPEKV